MKNKMWLVCMVFCLILVTGGQSVSAMPPPVKPAEDHTVTFQSVMNPVELGFIPGAEDWVAGMNLKAFKNQLYAVIWDDPSGVVVVRSSDGKQWERVTIPTPEQNGYVFSWDMTVYKGQLYLALTDIGIYGNPGLILRSPNGTDWEVAFQDDEAHTKLGTNVVDKFGVTEGYLYFTTVNNNTEVGNGQIWRSRSGSPDSWELVVPEVGTGFLGSTSTMVTFKGKIYFSGTDANGVHIWRSGDGKTWEIVGQGTLDDPANITDDNMVRFKGALYFTTDSTTGMRIYRSLDGVHWDLVVPDGFGNPATMGGCLIVYKNQLYAFTVDLPSLVSHAWRSRTGKPGEWENITPNGMGPDTLTIRGSQAVFKGKLFVASSFVNTPSVLYRMDE